MRSHGCDLYCLRIMLSKVDPRRLYNSSDLRPGYLQCVVPGGELPNWDTHFHRQTPALRSHSGASLLVIHSDDSNQDNENKGALKFVSLFNLANSG